MSTVKYNHSSRYITLLIFLFVFISSPFFFSDVFIGNSIITGLLQIGIVFLLLTHAGKLRQSHIFIILFLLTYVALQIYLRPSLTLNYFFPFIYCVFGVILYAVLYYRPNYIPSLLDTWKKWSVIISASIVLSVLLVRIVPPLFPSKVIAEYPMMFNYLLGSISIDEANPMRPAWYFYEPSYVGCYLGVCFFSSSYLSFKNNKNRYNYLALILFATLLVGSFSSLVSITICLLAGIILKNVKSRPIKYSLMIIICFVPIVFMMTNVEAFLDSSFISNHTASTGTRVRRIQDGLDVISSMGLKDLILGNGLEYHGSVFGEGQSIAYLRLLEEEGLAASIVYFIVLFKLLKNNTQLLLFVLLELLSVVIYYTPLMLFTFILFGLASNSIHQRIRETQYIVKT